MQRLGLTLITLLIMASPATADWLVTQDGSRIQTRGKWQVKGSMVVFTNHRGTFSSLPLRDIDLESSRTASQPVTRVQKPKAQVAPKAVQPMAVITNDDIRQVRAPQPQEPKISNDTNDTAAQDSPSAMEFGESSDIRDAAQGVTWHRVNDGEFQGVEVVGTLENDGDGVVTELGVMVSLRDHHDQVIATQRAVVQARSLMPGSYTRFQARFADLEIEEDEQTRVEVHCQAKRLVEKQADGKPRTLQP